MRVLDDAIEEYPNSSRLYLFKAKVSYSLNEKASAQQALEQSIRLGAKNAEVHLLLGDVFQDLNNTTSAILSYERSLSLDKDYEPAYERLIAISQKSQKMDELCNRWLMRYQNNKGHTTLKEYLISALHKADRFEDAEKIITNN
jgi:cytochrome c-type biogenesis protein CcmH/NrfG